MALFATSAFAVGADLTVGVCPGNPGASFDAGTIDCAGGTTIQLIVVFQPAEAITDLVGIEGVIDLDVYADLNTDANFWDFENTNSGALNGSQLPPTAGCANYRNTWDDTHSTFQHIQGIITRPTNIRIVGMAARPSNLSVAANEKLFGFQLTIDCNTSVLDVNDGVGFAKGCDVPGSFVLNSVVPESASGAMTTPLGNSSQATTCVAFNNSNACSIVAVARHTWGRLKSLYR